MKQLTGLVSNVANCFESELDPVDTAQTENPFVGSWKTVEDFGVH